MDNKTARVDYLIEQLHNQNITEPEFLELSDLFSQNEFEPLLHEMLLQDLHKQAPETISPDKLEKILMTLPVDPVAMPAAHRVHFLKTTWFRFAAAAILLLGGATAWLWLQRSEGMETNKQLLITQKKASVIPQATLTLADGTVIALDSSANGSVAKQGGVTIVKLSNGQLAYDFTPASAEMPAGEPVFNTITTPRGSQYQLLLDDGSRVWLNAGSSLVFPVHFTGNGRMVKLSGEAYFEIAKDASRFFKVTAGESEIDVLGTGFNVRAYNKETTTTLLEGSVRVNQDENQVLLRPGERAATATNTDGSFTLQRSKPDIDELERTVAWKDGMFRFNKDNIKPIMEEIARWYDVEVIFEGNIEKEFVAEMPRSLTLGETLKNLELTGKVHFRAEGKKIIVTR